MIQNYKSVKKYIKKNDTQIRQNHRQSDDGQGSFIVDLENQGAEHKHNGDCDICRQYFQKPRKSLWKSFKKVLEQGIVAQKHGVQRRDILGGQKQKRKGGCGNEHRESGFGTEFKSDYYDDQRRYGAYRHIDGLEKATDIQNHHAKGGEYCAER